MKKEEHIRRIIKKYGITAKQAEKMYEELKRLDGSKNNSKTVEEVVEEVLEDSRDSLQFTLELIQKVKNNSILVK